MYVVNLWALGHPTGVHEERLYMKSMTNETLEF